MKIVFATNNAHKLAEVQAVLGDAYELVMPRMCGVEEEIPENQPTLEGNASEKSHYLRARTGLDCFADDTGLEVEALDGAPGVHSARYASDGHDFAANNRLLLRNLEGVANRRARFRTVISLLVGDEEHLFEGVVEGRIVERESRGVRLRSALRARRLRPYLRRDVARREERRVAPRPRRAQTGRLPARPRRKVTPRLRHSGR